MWKSGEQVVLNNLRDEALRLGVCIQANSNSCWINNSWMEKGDTFSKVLKCIKEIVFLQWYCFELQQNFVENNQVNL